MMNMDIRSAIAVIMKDWENATNDSHGVLEPVRMYDREGLRKKLTAYVEAKVIDVLKGGKF